MHVTPGPNSELQAINKLITDHLSVMRHLLSKKSIKPHVDTESSDPEIFTFLDYNQCTYGE